VGVAGRRLGTTPRGASARSAAFAAWVRRDGRGTRARAPRASLPAGAGELTVIPPVTSPASGGGGVRRRCGAARRGRVSVVGGRRWATLGHDAWRRWRRKCGVRGAGASQWSRDARPRAPRVAPGRRGRVDGHTDRQPARIGRRRGEAAVRCGAMRPQRARIGRRPGGVRRTMRRGARSCDGRRTVRALPLARVPVSEPAARPRPEPAGAERHRAGHPRRATRAAPAAPPAPPRPRRPGRPAPAPRPCRRPPAAPPLPPPLPPAAGRPAPAAAPAAGRRPPRPCRRPRRPARRPAPGARRPAPAPRRAPAPAPRPCRRPRPAPCRRPAAPPPALRAPPRRCGRMGAACPGPSPCSSTPRPAAAGP
jgi:hypothetical protein